MFIKRMPSRPNPRMVSSAEIRSSRRTGATARVCSCGDALENGGGGNHGWERSRGGSRRPIGRCHVYLTRAEDLARDPLFGPKSGNIVHPSFLIAMRFRWGLGSRQEAWSDWRANRFPRERRAKTRRLHNLDQRFLVMIGVCLVGMEMAPGTSTLNFLA
jgi:hypothetical protein